MTNRRTKHALLPPPSTGHRHEPDLLCMTTSLGPSAGSCVPVAWTQASTADLRPEGREGGRPLSITGNSR